MKVKLHRGFLRLFPLFPGFFLVMALHAGDPDQASGLRVNLLPEERLYLERLGPLTVAPDPDWPPFEYFDDEGNFAGIAADLLNLVADRLGIEFSWVFPRDWPEALELSRAGDVLILPFLNQTPEREEWLVFTDPLLVDPNVFITRQEHPFIADAAQFTDETIVFPQGTSMEERVRRDFPNLRVLTVPSEKDVFQAVLDGRADMALRSLAISAYTIRKEGLFNLKIAGQAPDAYVNRLRMGVLRGQEPLREILNRGIATITPREREEIVNRHVNITVVRPVYLSAAFRVLAVLVVLVLVSLFWNHRLRKANHALQESERSKSVLLASLPGMAYRCRDDGSWTMELVSEGSRGLTGYGSEDIIHNRVVSYDDIIHPDDRDQVRRAWAEAKTRQGLHRLEYRIRTANGEERWVFEQGMYVGSDSRGAGIIEGLIIDITDRKRAEDSLYHMAVHDQLTELFNRHHVLERLGNLMEEYLREGREFSFCMIDLDHFKAINDTWGHAAGDLVLREFARVLASSVRSYDLSGRFGGEEFVVVLVNAGVPEAHELFGRLQRRIRETDVLFQGTPLRITFSGGVSTTRDVLSPSSAGQGLQELIAIADGRLYQAKREGRNRIVYPDES
ncbi:diguanylate cyclase [Alkalispirochaeta sphaeroplastigenens]|uniref:diguanylate cyclase n=1 Tax=Alkalispirochaeta sphaeroplastigenens TaxID=1187066 RepID=A0A2S4JMY2_9SPIO|nr:diguanylate cyclase [Alkalispirochaeta sphaeroplastigenens]POR00852.1 diguanylate cyclase [Alkalispirochaeta sphaeroplastigenens]